MAIPNRSTRRAPNRSQVLKCPRGLTRAGRRLWFDVRDHLDRFGIPADGMGPRLEMLCVAWGNHHKASAYLQRYGFSGRHYVEASRMLRSSWRIVMPCLKDFGGTPLARAQLARKGVLRLPA